MKAGEYLQKIEDCLALHGVKRMPSRKEQGVIEGLRQKGVTLFLVTEAIKDTARCNRDIGSFSYFVPVIQQRHETVTISAEAVSKPATIDIAAKVADLEAMLPESLPIRDKVIAEIRRVASVERAEHAEKLLTDIDRRIVEWGRLSLGERVSQELEDWINRFRFQFQNRDPISERACMALTARIVRAKMGVPRLSLFTEKP